VDDTCEARVELFFALPNQGGRTVSAAASIFVAPPDFAPDRRPFLSLADELNDRSADATARSAAMGAADLDAWVEDLFERVYETASLFNVDFWRNAGRAANLAGAQVAAPIVGDGVANPTRAMGGRDALRNRLYALPAATAVERLPLSEHARMRHRTLSDLEALRGFVQNNPGRIQSLVRRPFALLPNEDALRTTMAMPPFMRNSNALPLTLAAWQYELLIRWVAAAQSAGGPIGGVPAAAPMSAAAAARREEILRAMGDGAPS
jgi:hypothetical protein